MNKEQAKAIIEKLVNRYAEQQKSYHASDYNETKTRRDFIDPFFKALGWDMDNEQDVAEPYREVIHEDKVKIQGKTKSPDYGFRLQGAKQQLFFVEAKKPSVSLKVNKEPAFQIRRYGWNSKASVSILTNFEDFMVYDCSKKPSVNDSASVGRIKTINYQNYLQEFDFIYDTFSHEAILKGRFDAYIKSDTAKKGTQTLDKEFVASLDNWRQYLAVDIAKSNAKITEDELNFAVQLIIDRLIFLRFCEDRGVEPYGQLKAATSKGTAYENLHSVFKAADDKYNSGLFDFDKDKITHSLKITNKVIKNIVEDLYPPNSEYDFKALPVEVLGNAYEQFLGKVIRIDTAHRAIIEEKPEVRKAGGVYYTPQYIVDYIVENTVGKLIAGKTPKEIESIKIVDPACGSGSFLLGAYHYLLNYHINYYHQNPPSAKSGIITPIGTLSTAIKKKILINNIYGVDLDANAVEVSKLSLLLKCMEGETAASISQQLTMHSERILPDLDNNIKDGNSLIDTDIYDCEMELGFEKKIKPFSWKNQFPQVFKQGGFDAVIGNPPYLKLTANNIDKNILEYYEKKYKSYSGGSSKNLFQLFSERIIDLQPKIASFIIPEALLTSDSNGTIRNILTKNFNLNSIVTFDHFVFQDATIGTTIFVAEKDSKEKTKIIKINNQKKQILLQEIVIKNSNAQWDVSFDNESKFIFENILKSSQLMGEIVEMSKGMVVKDRNDVLLKSPSKKSIPFLLGKCMSRYTYEYDKYAEYDNLEIIGGTRNFDKQTSIPRLLIRRTGNSLCATYSNKIELIESTIYILRSSKIDLKFLLGLINSKLFTFYLSKKLITNSQGFPQILMGQLEQLPITKKAIKEKSKHDDIIKLVDLLLKLNEELKVLKLQTQIEQHKQRIQHSEGKINQLVYELYELTDEEIAIVENSLIKK